MMRTYEDYLREKGKVITDLFDCPECGKSHVAFAIVEREPGDWVCSSCYLIDVDKAAAEEAEAAKAALAPWDTELANHVRAMRTQLQDRWRWAVMPDSPLHQDAQDRVMVFLKLLNTLTLDYTSPEDVVWPTDPIITGDDYDPVA